MTYNVTRIQYHNDLSNFPVSWYILQTKRSTNQNSLTNAFFGSCFISSPLIRSNPGAFLSFKLF